MAIFAFDANAKAQSHTTKTTKSSPPSVILTMGTQSVDCHIALRHRIGKLFPVEIFRRVGAACGVAVCAAYKEECVDEEDAKLDKAAKECKSIQATLGYLQHLYRLMMFFGVLYVLLGASILTIAEDIAHLAPVEIPITANGIESVGEPYRQAYLLCGFGMAAVLVAFIGLYTKHTSEMSYELFSNGGLLIVFVFHTTALSTWLNATRFTAKFATAIHTGIQNHSADAALAIRLQSVQTTLGCCGWTGPGDYSPSGNVTEPLPPLCPTRLAYSANPVQLLVAFSGQLFTGCQTSLLFTLLTVASTGLLLCQLIAFFFIWQLSGLAMRQKKLNLLAWGNNFALMFYSIPPLLFSLLCPFDTSHECQKIFGKSIAFTLFTLYHSAVLLSGLFGHIAHRRQSVRLLDLFATTILPVLIFFNILSLIHYRTILEIKYVQEAHTEEASVMYLLLLLSLMIRQSANLYFTLRISADLKRKAKAQEGEALVRKIFSRFRERERLVQSSVRAKVTGPQVD